MIDIVEQLRYHAQGGAHISREDLFDACAKAADEIQRLRSLVIEVIQENKNLTAELTDCNNEVHNWYKKFGSDD